MKFVIAHNGTIVETVDNVGRFGRFIYQGSRKITVGDDVEIGNKYATVTKVYTADLFDLPWDIDYAW